LRSPSVPATATATGRVIAVAATFDIHIDMAAALPDRASMSERRPRASRVTARARRWPRPCVCIASARKKEPTNRNRSGLPKAPKA